MMVIAPEVFIADRIRPLFAMAHGCGMVPVDGELRSGAVCGICEQTVQTHVAEVLESLRSAAERIQ